MLLGHILSSFKVKLFFVLQTRVPFTLVYDKNHETQSAVSTVVPQFPYYTRNGTLHMTAWVVHMY